MNLLHESGEPQRSYAKNIAADGVITYSYSTESFKWTEPSTSYRWTDAAGLTSNPIAADTEQISWIDTIFGFIDSITGVRFQKVENARGELHINFADDSNTAPSVLLNGYMEINPWHDKYQYGGIQDIRSIQVAIATALGVTAPNGNPDNDDYTWSDTLMTYKNPTSFGATFFYSQGDQDALRSILGSNNDANNSRPAEIVHKTTRREHLLLGTNGVRDIFQVTTKGSLLDRGTDENGIINHYNNSYIANMNPLDGDKILLHRSLLSPKTPMFGASKKLAKKYKKVKIQFLEDLRAVNYDKGANVYYNGAGKLLIDTNGSKSGVTQQGSPKRPEFYRYNGAGLNGQIAAFVDPFGPESMEFLAEWVDFFA
jgi:hypothetical protein